MLQISQEPPVGRLQIRNKRQDALLQIQNGRLHYNWIGRQDDGYPRYDSVRPKFDSLLSEFEQFLSAQELGGLKPNQWEVTYVDHIPQGTVWNDPADWGRLFVGLPGVWGPPSEVLLESLAAAWHFEIPERRGRLHIDLKHGKLVEGEPRGVLRMTLTARGPVDEKTLLSDGLDLGRRVIVLTFRDVTANDAHEFWELEP